MNAGRSQPMKDRIGPDDHRWLAAQLLLFGLMVLCGPGGRWLIGRLSVPWPVAVDIFAGVLLMLVGMVIMGQANADLGDSLRVAPTPLDEAELVDHGWYGRVRHPIYLAVFLGLAGWTVAWMNWLVVAMAVVTTMYFNLKTRYEERKLRETYAGYADCMVRVKARFVPKVW